jgi:hypothetical protein
MNTLLYHDYLPYIKHNVIFNIHGTILLLNVLSAGPGRLLHQKGNFIRGTESVSGLRSYSYLAPGILLLVGFLRTERQIIQRRRSQIHWHTFSQVHLPHTFTPKTRDELRISLPRPIRDMERKI